MRMAESPQDPKRPSSQPKYLPRIVYQPPEPDPDDAEAQEGLTASASAPGDAARKKEKPSAPNPPRAGKPEPARPAPVPNPTRPGQVESVRPKNKAKGLSAIPEKKGMLVEETPEGETFDARRRMRLMVGGVAGTILVLAVFLIYRSLRPDTPEVDPEPPTGGQVASAPPKQSPKVREELAKGILAEARLLERDGKLVDALKRVERVVAEFGETPSAKLAISARERNKQGLPLFVTGAAVIATKAEPMPTGPTESEPPTETTPPAAEVEVEKPATLVPPGTAVVEIVPKSPTATPANTAATAGSALAEPRRPTGVGLPKAEVPAHALPPGFHAREEAGVHASGWPLEITCDRDGGSMVLVPGETFTQGRDDGKPEERPAHKVQLSSYYIDQHEITGRQFSLFRKGMPVNDLPVVNVTQAEARAYAQWAGKALPSEAQWEMAARTPDGRLHPWGNPKAQWDRTRDPKQIDPVMSFPNDLSPYGAFDLAGNAWEWTNDWFDTKYYATLKGKTAINPGGPPKGRAKIPEVVIKGGSKDWDGSWRTGTRTDARLPYLGFRCVLNVEGAPVTTPAPGQPGNAPNLPSGTVPF
ncbi:MAG: hypothetical protein JWN86_2385 [Planctomycetota bacterium]|nr:hypothetical protein [Planctomycetota bacterium]